MLSIDIWTRKQAGAAVPVLDVNWWKRFQVGGQMPSAVLDFENGAYYDGSNNNAALSSLLTGSPSVNSSGLDASSTTLVGTAALTAAFAGGSFSVAATVAGATPAINSGAVGLNGNDGPMFHNAASEGLNDYRNAGGHSITAQIGPTWTQRNRFFSSSSATARKIDWDWGPQLGSGTDISGSDAFPFAANPTSVELAYMPLSPGPFGPLGGRICNLSVIKAIVSSIKGYAAPAWTGVNGINTHLGLGAQGVKYGNVLQYEYTQPWTVVAAICLMSSPGSAGVIFTTSSISPFPGYELWVDTAANSGKLRVRIISNFTAPFYIGLSGSTNLIDRKWHVVAATYSGSGLASGVKMYVDGVLETTTIESDTLGGNTIKDPSNYFCLGNQTGSGGVIGSTSNQLPGYLGLFRLYNVVKSAAFIQSFRINYILPAIDGSCALAPRLDEGGSNLTTADLSASGLTGTLSSSSIWLRG